MKTKSKQNIISVLIPDGESHILLYVVNCLAQIKHIDIYVMSNTKYHPMRYSRYIKKFTYYAETSSDLDWIENINKEVKRHSIDVVMPIFESRIKTLIQYRSKIIQQDQLGLLSNIEDYETAFNKNKLTKHLEANQIPYAKCTLVTSFADLDKVNGLKFPVIIKPVEGYGGGQGIFKFDSKDELLAHFKKYPMIYNNIVQEYVQGYDIDCSVLCKDGQILAYTIQKGNMIGTHQFSPQFGVQFQYNKKLIDTVKHIMKSLNWSGVAHLDMRYDAHTDQYKAIEINTRFWVSLEASLLAGVNFPYLYCLSSLDKEFIAPEYKVIDFLNLKGLIKQIKKDKRFIVKFNFIRNNTPLKYSLSDPIPTIYKWIWRTKNILKSKINK
ncbi:carboxylate--amine ligase [Winogradskyella ursingii]|uniref:carboxylate--amine ligase n=1 Tax=Winogradskyella ursingii TaxID=2686079 RepID=UPI0015C81B5D|nr:ATP-grasp domain-containing protein [Winogradskyella ursingii]